MGFPTLLPLRAFPRFGAIPLRHRSLTHPCPAPYPGPTYIPWCRLVEQDLAAALVYYTFAANAGDPVAQMSMGYRHLQGIDVPRSCQTGEAG